MGVSNKANILRRELHTKKFKFKKNDYKFREKLIDLFGVELGSLHKTLGNYEIWKDGASTQSTLAHKVFYSNFNKGFDLIYFRFIKDFISKIVDVPFYFQKIPTFRIGLPGNVFVSTFHKDSEFNHLDYEINFNLGLENYEGGNFFVEISPESNEFMHMKCPYGEIFSLNHIDCIHGAKPNLTDKTMVSIDFRLAIKECYYEGNRESLTNKTKFAKDYYFSSELIS